MGLLKEHRIREGKIAVLLQSGLDEEWWTDSMECYCHLRNIQDLLSDGTTLYERRFGGPFKRTNDSMWFDNRISPFFLPNTCQDSTSSVRKFYLECWSVMSCMGEG